MARAKDLGPEFPGDAGDTLPANPTAGLTQQDYLVGRTIPGGGFALPEEEEASAVTLDLSETSIIDYTSALGARLSTLLALGEDVDSISRVALNVLGHILGYDASGTKRVAQTQYGYVEHLNKWLAAPLVQLKLVSVQDDAITCHSFDDGIEGVTPIVIAKPYKLRRTPFDGFTVAGVSYVYNSAIEREATDVTPLTILEEIVPRYTVGDVIYAMHVAGNAGISLIDANLDARYWSKTADV